MTIEEFYGAINVDVEEVKKRFGMLKIAQKFLPRFIDDPSFSQLQDAMAAGDGEAAFKASHTLKGVALNLSLNELGAIASEVTEALRGEEKDMATAAEANQRLIPVYEDVIAKIKEVK